MTDVIASFERGAPNYLAHAGVQEAMADWVGEWLPRPRKGRVLEVGAGPGVFTRRLLPWHGDLMVTDASAAMCRAGRKALPEVKWRTMLAEKPLPGPWDWIVSSSMLQWMGDPAEVFSAWHRRLAPGGRVLGGLFIAGSLPEWSEVAGKWSPLRWRSAEEWREAVAGAGLRLLRDETQTRVFDYSSARDFLRSLHAIGAAPRRRLGAGVLRRLLRRHEERGGRGGPVAAHWNFYRFEAIYG
ncbi:MAG TPA: methyltransferase domain-containing protein [Opitutaceae bacterium]|jgi:SAM-dependent methyltransferase|nr:methyltransferase domain-containing protein [Opitutaceae bacterium]